MKAPPRPHITAHAHGSITLITPHDKPARDWLDANTATEPWQWFGGSLAVEPRLAPAILAAAEADGHRTNLRAR